MQTEDDPPLNVPRNADTSAAFRLEANARIDSLHVEGDVAGRDVVKITQDLTHDVSDLGVNPYRGLASFTYETRDFFGGRDQQIEEALRRLSADGEQPVLLFITGASGSGKSSFAQAGLVPALQAWYEAHGRRARWAIARPGGHPLAALARALETLGVPASGDLTSVLRTPEGFQQLLSRQTPPEQINLLVLDQFEEIFTQSEPAERDGLCALLSSPAPFDTLRTHILVTLRSDYLPRIFEIPSLFAVFKLHGIELRAMARDELARAIRKPLQEQARREQKVKSWDPALVDRLVEDVGDDPTLLPLLQVTLTALWDEPPHRLTLDRYRTLTDALEQQADRALDWDGHGQRRSEADRQEMLGIFLDLVEVSMDEDPHRDVRRTVPKRDLLADHPERERLIQELVDARLLATSLEQRGETSVELVDIIHETLLRNWPRLHEAIMARREALQSRERLRLEVHDWVEHERSDEYLLQGVRLAEAHELAGRRDIALRDADAMALLERSNVVAEMERQRELEQARALAAE